MNPQPVALAPIRRELIVATDVQSAFGWFTAHIGAWWPVAELSVLGAESSVGFEG
ncbi:MAG: Activator of Hsp90 ATPase 1-like protein, partial [Ilumatobacteraceae bacterium]|nr:Activator of Hsp90 ATPase 1-like protein [Ilumatobacteraceae bacterium]